MATVYGNLGTCLDSVWSIFTHSRALYLLCFCVPLVFCSGGSSVLLFNTFSVAGHYTDFFISLFTFLCFTRLLMSLRPIFYFIPDYTVQFVLLHLLLPHPHIAPFTPYAFLGICSRRCLVFSLFLPIFACLSSGSFVREVGGRGLRVHPHV